MECPVSISTVTLVACIGLAACGGGGGDSGSSSGPATGLRNLPGTPDQVLAVDDGFGAEGRFVAPKQGPLDSDELSFIRGRVASRTGDTSQNPSLEIVNPDFVLSEASAVDSEFVDAGGMSLSIDGSSDSASGPSITFIVIGTWERNGASRSFWGAWGPEYTPDGAFKGSGLYEIDAYLGPQLELRSSELTGIGTSGSDEAGDSNLLTGSFTLGVNFATGKTQSFAIQFVESDGPTVRASLSGDGFDIDVETGSFRGDATLDGDLFESGQQDAFVSGNLAGAGGKGVVGVIHNETYAGAFAGNMCASSAEPDPTLSCPP